MRKYKKRICLRMAEILEIIPVAESTIRRWIAIEAFPAPVKIGNVALFFKKEVFEALDFYKKNGGIYI